MSRTSRAAVLDVYEVRRTLELETARLAAQRRTEKDLRVRQPQSGAGGSLPLVRHGAS